MNERKLAVARELGATATVNAASPDAAEQIRELTRRRRRLRLRDGGLDARARTRLPHHRPRRHDRERRPARTRSSSSACSTSSLVAEERTLKGSYLGSCVPSRDIPRYIEWYRAGPAAGGPPAERAPAARRHQRRLRPPRGRRVHPPGRGDRLSLARAARGHHPPRLRRCGRRGAVAPGGRRRHGRRLAQRVRPGRRPASRASAARVSLENFGGFASVRTPPRDWDTAGRHGLRAARARRRQAYKFTLRTGDGFDGIQYQARFAAAGRRVDRRAPAGRVVRRRPSAGARCRSRRRSIPPRCARSA